MQCLNKIEIDKDPFGVQPGIFEKNRIVLEQKWPEILRFLDAAEGFECVDYQLKTPNPVLIINGLHVGSSYNSTAEALLQSALVADSEKEAWVYGVGTGELPCVLLARDGIRNLHVVVIDSGVFKVSLKHVDHQPWLCDDRVDLILPSKSARLKLPFCVNPVSVTLADPKASRICAALEHELRSASIRKRFKINAKAIKKIKANETYIRKDRDVCELFNTRGGAEFVVVGCGHALPESVDAIKQQKGIRIVAVAAALKALLEKGIALEFVISADHAGSEQLVLSQQEKEALRHSALVYFPSISDKFIAHWPGSRYVAYGPAAFYYEGAQKNVKGYLNFSTTALHAAIGLAVKMGASVVKFCGLSPQPGQNLRNGEFRRYSIENESGEFLSSDPVLYAQLQEMKCYIQSHSAVRFVHLSRREPKIAGVGYEHD